MEKANIRTNSAVWTSSRTPPTMVKMPLEALHHIFQYLEPPDIIVLRMTCRTLASVSTQRTVWLEAVRRICDTNGLFRPSYPLEDMSQEALEHAASFPFRFSSRLWKKDPIMPFTTRLLESRMTNWAEKDNHSPFDRLALIPGGRFLITESTDAISLWDLRNNSLGYAKPFPVASITIASALMMTVHPTPDGLGIRMCIANAISHPPIRTITDVSVYEVYPLSSSPEFVRIAQRSNVNVLYSPGAFAATQYCIALSHASGCLTVWDFVLDSVVTWRVDADENPDCRDKVVLFDDYVGVGNPKHFSLYKIPPLQPCSDIENPCDFRAFLASVGPGYYHPTIKFAHSSWTTPTHIAIPSRSWMPNNQRPLLFSIVLRHEGRIVVDRYRMETSDKRLAPNLPENIPIFIAASEFQYNLTFVGSMRFCAKYWTQSWRDGHNVMLGLSKVSDDSLADGGYSNSATTKLWTTDDRILFFDFCPASGRLCVITDNHEIRVIDFLTTF